MDKDKIIKILLVILVVLTACFLTYALTTSTQNRNTFERVNLSSTCSIELPKIHFDVQNSSFGGSYGDIWTFTSSELVITYVKTSDNTGLSFDGLYNGNNQINVGHTNWYSRDVTNLATGEIIVVSGTNKTLVDRIADSIIFSTGENINNNNTTNAVPTSSSNNNNRNNTPNTNTNPTTEGQSNNNNPTPNPIPDPAPTPSPSPEASSDGGAADGSGNIV